MINKKKKSATINAETLDLIDFTEPVGTVDDSEAVLVNFDTFDESPGTAVSFMLVDDRSAR